LRLIRHTLQLFDVLNVRSSASGKMAYEKLAMATYSATYVKIVAIASVNPT